MDSNDIIQRFQLERHPEGGYYKRMYTSAQQIITNTGKTRNISTAIYYLLDKNDISRFHRIQSDELWFFHQGYSLEIIMILNGKLEVIILGNNIKEGEVPQIKIQANTWFAAQVKGNKGYSFVSCMVSPGFDFDDFELAEGDGLIQQYPHLKSIIENFT